MEPLETQTKPVNISACLEAASMYDADAHRDRGGDPYAPQPCLQVVSLWQYWWTRTVKAGIGLAGGMLMLVVWLAITLIFANVVKNVCDVYRAQPIIRNEIGSVEYPLPDDYGETNFRLYRLLAFVIVVAYGGSRISLRRARAILVGVPLTPANTANLPAPESLVRASSEPIQAQEAVLLRGAGQGQETPPEQLVRACVGQE